MPGDAAATRRRLLDAATQEFSTHGLAGARVDRIAAAAGSNKAQIYHYFGSKESLFDAVFDEIVTQTLATVPLDPDDLPGYAGRLFDSYVERPHVLRIATWHRLEAGRRVASIEESNRAKIDTLAQAQGDGRLGKDFSPTEILGIVLHLAALWDSGVPEFDDLVTTSVEHRRAVVVEAVRRVVN